MDRIPAREGVSGNSVHSEPSLHVIPILSAYQRRLDEGFYLSPSSNLNSQWIFRNYTLHNKQQDYLCLRLRSEVLRKIHELLETSPSEVPPESQYLLELDHSAMYKASYEEHAHWVLALKAARRANRRAITTQRARGRSQRLRLAATRKTRIRYNFSGL